MDCLHAQKLRVLCAFFSVAVLINVALSESQVMRLMPHVACLNIAGRMVPGFEAFDVRRGAWDVGLLFMCDFTWP